MQDCFLCKGFPPYIFYILLHDVLNSSLSVFQEARKGPQESEKKACDCQQNEGGPQPRLRCRCVRFIADTSAVRLRS